MARFFSVLNRDKFWSLNKSAKTEKLNLGYKRTTAPRSLAFNVTSTALPTTFSNLLLTFSEKNVHCIWILIHATWTVSYKQHNCNESGLCGSPWSSPEVTITRVLTSLSELHFPSSCTRTLIISSPDAHLWDYLIHTHTHTHTLIVKSIAPADISERSHLSLFDHCVLTLDCFYRFGLISACLLTLLPALILCSCLSSDIPVTVTGHCLYDCVNSY